MQSQSVFKSPGGGYIPNAFTTARLTTGCPMILSCTPYRVMCSLTTPVVDSCVTDQPPVRVHRRSFLVPAKLFEGNAGGQGRVHGVPEQLVTVMPRDGGVVLCVDHGDVVRA